MNLTRGLGKKDLEKPPFSPSEIASFGPPSHQSFPCLSLGVWMFLELHIAYYSALLHDDNRDLI